MKYPRINLLTLFNFKNLAKDFESVVIQIKNRVTVNLKHKESWTAINRQNYFPNRIPMAQKPNNVHTKLSSRIEIKNLPFVCNDLDAVKFLMLRN